MEHKAKSIRPFIGAKNFELSRRFYRDLGFEESVLFPNMSLFQDRWIGVLSAGCLRQGLGGQFNDISWKWKMLNVIGRNFLALDLTVKYEGVRLTPIRKNDWGNEYFLHDPSGILWHFGEFKK